jgi:hypothetical protein
MFMISLGNWQEYVFSYRRRKEWVSSIYSRDKYKITG